jgi:hypothetical protein
VAKADALSDDIGVVREKDVWGNLGISSSSSEKIGLELGFLLAT